MTTSKHLSTLAVFLGIAACAHADLQVGDFLNAGDKLLVTDTSTGLQWLAPLYTSGHTYDDSFVQSVIATYGFQYAAESTVIDMIDNNFNSPPSTFPGTAAGFADAQAFFDVFGINEQVSCGGPCPRTQGLTSTSQSTGYQDAVGMIQYSGGGYIIEQNSWPDAIADPQVGS